MAAERTLAMAARSSDSCKLEWTVVTVGSTEHRPVAATATKANIGPGVIAIQETIIALCWGLAVFLVRSEFPRWVPASAGAAGRQAVSWGYSSRSGGAG